MKTELLMHPRVRTAIQRSFEESIRVKPATFRVSHEKVVLIDFVSYLERAFFWFKSKPKRPSFQQKVNRYV